MVGVKYFLDICIICVHKAHFREKSGVLGPFFFWWNFWIVCLLDANHVNWKKIFQTSFYNPRDLPYHFLGIFSKIKDPSWKILGGGGRKMTPKKQVFLTLLQHCYFNTVENFLMLLQHCRKFLYLTDFLYFDFKHIFGRFQKKVAPPNSHLQQ